MIILKPLDEEPYDLILLDGQMPEMDDGKIIETRQAPLFGAHV